MNYNVIIQRGKGLGKSRLGFPTANGVVQDGATDEPIGAWVVEVQFDNKKYKGFTGICKHGKDLVLETHILDFDGDLYDKRIYIRTIWKIRGGMVFASLDESKVQIQKDYEFTNNWDLTKTCENCKFFVKKDYGYSNYTVEGTTGSCLAGKHPAAEFEVSYDSQPEYEVAKQCSYYNKGECWDLDCDGENESPSDEWVKTEMRDFNIKEIVSNGTV